MDLTEGNVTLPVAGKVKKAYVIVPAGAALAYVAYRWYQARQDAAGPDAPAASDGMYTTPDQSEYGMSTGGGATTVTGNNGSTTTDGTGGLATNADWTNKAVDLLTQQGYDGMTVQAALGDFLARRSLTPAEAAIARAAVAVAGQPPVGGPFPFNEQASTGTGTLAAPAHLRKWDAPTDTQIGIQWDPVAGASHYRIYRTDLGSEPIGDSYDTKFWARGLTPDHGYTFKVAAVSAEGKTGKQSSSYSGHTASRKLGKPTGLKASAITKSSFRVSCAPVKGAEFYKWMVNGRESGATDKPYRDFTGMHSNTSYSITVRADLHTQAPGPVSSPIHVKTKK